MKIKSFSKNFVSYGHYKLNVVLEDGRSFSAVTGDTELIGNLNSVIDEEKIDAKRQAVRLVLEENNISE